MIVALATIAVRWFVLLGSLYVVAKTVEHFIVD
jgi:hypothetical protein